MLSNNQLRKKYITLQTGSHACMSLTFVVYVYTLIYDFGEVNLLGMYTSMTPMRKKK